MTIAQKEARRKYNTEWASQDRAKNIEKYREKERLASAKRRTENPGRIKEHVKRWRENNPDKMKFYYIKSKFGITREEYGALLVAQQGKCAICEQVMNTPFIDHCHQTNKVRGLLCQHCNTGLGFFKDDARALEGALLYLHLHAKNL